MLSTNPDEEDTCRPPDHDGCPQPRSRWCRQHPPHESPDCVDHRRSCTSQVCEEGMCKVSLPEQDVGEAADGRVTTTPNPAQPSVHICCSRSSGPLYSQDYG